MGSHWKFRSVLLVAVLCEALVACLTSAADAREYNLKTRPITGDPLSKPVRKLAQTIDTQSDGAPVRDTPVEIFHSAGAVHVPLVHGSIKQYYYDYYGRRHYQRRGFAWWGIFLICFGVVAFVTIFLCAMLARRISLQRAHKARQAARLHGGFDPMAAQMPYQGPYPPYNSTDYQQHQQYYYAQQGEVPQAPHAATGYPAGSAGTHGPDQPPAGHGPHQPATAPNPYPAVTDVAVKK